MVTVRAMAGGRRAVEAPTVREAPWCAYEVGCIGEQQITLCTENGVADDMCAERNGAQPRQHTAAAKRVTHLLKNSLLLFATCVPLVVRKGLGQGDVGSLILDGVRAVEQCKQADCRYRLSRGDRRAVHALRRRCIVAKLIHQIPPALCPPLLVQLPALVHRHNHVAEYNTHLCNQKNNLMGPLMSLPFQYPPTTLQAPKKSLDIFSNGNLLSGGVPLLLCGRGGIRMLEDRPSRVNAVPKNVQQPLAPKTVEDEPVG